MSCVVAEAGAMCYTGGGEIRFLPAGADVPAIETAQTTIVGARVANLAVSHVKPSNKGCIETYGNSSQLRPAGQSLLPQPIA